MVIEAQVHEIENCGIDEVPVLHFSTPHHQAGAPHAVDEKGRFAGRIVRDLREGFEHPRGIGNGCLKHEHPLVGCGNFGDPIDRALDQQRAGHPATHLHRGRTVQMRVIPIRARWVVRADREFVLPGCPTPIDLPADWLSRARARH